MKHPKLLSVLVLLVVVAGGCVFSTTYSNRAQDKQEAEKVNNLLFDDLKSKNYDAAYKLFSKDFFAATNKEKLSNIFTFTQDKLGNLKTAEVSQWETRIITGTNPSADYQFVYKNRYQKYPAEVTIRLTKETGGKLKIIGYHISSDGFFVK
jgi:hypothetical protein